MPPTPKKMHNSISRIKKENSNGEQITAPDVHTFVGDLIKYSEETIIAADSLIGNAEKLGIFEGHDLTKIEIQEKMVPFFLTAKNTNDIFLNLHEKKYTTAIITALEIPSNFKSNKFSTNTILSLSNTLNSEKKVLILQELFKITDFKQKDDDLTDLELLRLRLEKEFTFNNTSIIATHIAKITDAIKNKKYSDFLEHKKALQDELKKAPESFISTYTDIKLQPLIYNHLKTILEESKFGALEKELLTKKVSEFVKNHPFQYNLGRKRQFKASRKRSFESF